MNLLNKKSKPQNTTKNDGEMPIEESASVNKTTIRRVVFLVVTVLIVAGIGLFVTKYKYLFVVAKVDGAYITRYELANELLGLYGKSELDSLITYRLVKKALADEGIVATEEDIDAEVEKVKSNLEKQGQDFDTALSAQNLTMEEFRDRLAVDVAFNKKFENAGSEEPTEEEIAAQIDNYSYMFAELSEEESRAQAIDMIKNMKHQQAVNSWIQSIRDASDVSTFIE